mmetsp:Transcript_20035/g.59810  ORF Transcript_20035/g.59810 Transcript_20035/m.59810 type:complete len:154 (-) Transcript_20035:536-997(-)
MALRAPRIERHDRGPSSRRSGPRLPRGYSVEAGRGAAAVAARTEAERTVREREPRTLRAPRRRRLRASTPTVRSSSPRGARRAAPVLKKLKASSDTSAVRCTALLRVASTHTADRAPCAAPPNLRAPPKLPEVNTVAHAHPPRPAHASGRRRR